MSRVITFLLGLYGGAFLAQHYNIPRVDDPMQLYERIKTFMENYKKDDNDSSGKK